MAKNPDESKPTAQMKWKLEREIEKVKSFKRINPKGIPVRQLEGVERLIFIARCRVRRFHDQIPALKTFIGREALYDFEAENIIRIYNEWKDQK